MEARYLSPDDIPIDMETVAALAPVSSDEEAEAFVASIEEAGGYLAYDLETDQLAAFHEDNTLMTDDDLRHAYSDFIDDWADRD